MPETALLVDNVFSNIGEYKIQQLGPKVREIVGEQQMILKIIGIAEHESYNIYLFIFNANITRI